MPPFSLKEDLKYKESEKFCLASSQDITNIAQPMLDYLGAVGGFSFQRIYEDGKRLWLSTSEKWIECFYDNEYFLSMGYNKFKSVNMMLWEQWPQADESFIKLISTAKEGFSYGNGITINLKRDHYIDSFGFRGSADDKDINRRYLNNIFVIEKFLEFFLIKAEKLISQASHCRFDACEPSVIDDINNNPLNFQDLYEIKKICDDLKFLVDDKGVPLSPRMSECVYLTILGYTAKRIAKKLNISQRTVEGHIERFKMKLGGVSKSQAISKVCSNKKNAELISEYFLSKKK